MLTNVFITFLNMSISGAVVAVLLIFWHKISHRFVPSKFYYMLWIILMFRLTIPFTPKSVFSVLNIFKGISDFSYGGRYVVTMEYLEYNGVTNSVAEISSGLIDYIAVIWLVIALLLIFLWLFFYLSAQHKLKYAILYKNNITEQIKKDFNVNKDIKIFSSSYILSPVVIGFTNPRIIVPRNEPLDENNLKYAIAHEFVHIKRNDQITKALFFIILALHWYNPLVWLSFYIFNEDIETSCDQRVLSVYGMEHKSRYAYVLIDYAERRNTFKMGYLSFAKTKVEARIEKVLEYKNLTVLKKIIFTVVTLSIGLCVSTNPVLANEYHYVPDTVYLNSTMRSYIDEYVQLFAEDIGKGDISAIVEKSTADTEYFKPLYHQFGNSGLKLKVDKIFYTSEKSADVHYKLIENNGIVFPDQTRSIVAEIDSSKIMNGLYVDTLHTYEKYNSIHLIDHTDEAVMLVEKMIKFNLTEGSNTAENADKITAFCMDIAYDRAKDENMVLIPQKVVEDIAEEFFMFCDFTNLQNTDYFDKKAKAYRYDKSLGQRYECEIVHINKTESEATITVEFYKDPLQTQVEKIVKYTLKKV